MSLSDFDVTFVHTDVTGVGKHVTMIVSDEQNCSRQHHGRSTATRATTTVNNRRPNHDRTGHSLAHQPPPQLHFNPPTPVQPHHNPPARCPAPPQPTSPQPLPEPTNPSPAIAAQPTATPPTVHQHPHSPHVNLPDLISLIVENLDPQLNTPCLTISEREEERRKRKVKMVSR
ncbi:unnamed protein product [Cuscuta europaea]|uniref:Uncharacterized protein n=1 Tax=Cuscuta europaea TaxID=41803 RepID=A0A9P0ZYP4_CUSEU|nr:unnamed protein product [Cuscuta europaea]